MSALDPVTLQVTLGGLHSTCEEMGAVLIRSAHSANIKERRDASTALFDERGQMVMQAEHIPVHLGAMPAAVGTVLDEPHEPGDTWILNDPYRGGTHLPDITAISPIFVERELLGFAVNRAHHADVGGSMPGSMPADSRTLDDEGVVIGPTRLVRGGELDRDALEGDRVAHARSATARGGLPRPAGGQPRRDRPFAGARRPLRARGPTRGDRRDARLCGAADARRAARSRGRNLERARRARGERGRSRVAPRSSARERDAGARLQWLGRAAPRQPQLPARGHPLGVLLRRPRARRPRRPGVRRRVPARGGDRPRRVAAERRGRRPRSSRGTSRPPRGSPTSCCGRSARRSARAR